jgi:hypothetical protein
MELSSSSEQLAEQAKKLEMGTEELSTLLRGGGTDEIQNPDAEHAA